MEVFILGAAAAVLLTFGVVRARQVRDARAREFAQMVIGDSAYEEGGAEADHASESSSGSPARTFRRPSLLLTAGVIAAAGVVGVTAWMMSLAGWEPDEHSARASCQAWVREQLVSPRSAAFSRVRATPQPSELPTWRVVGDVEADNRLGVSVRSTWTCVASWSELSDDWVGSATIE